MKINDFNTIVTKVSKSQIDFDERRYADEDYCFDFDGQCFEYMGDITDPMFRAIGCDSYEYDYVTQPILHMLLCKEAKKLGIMP